MRGGIKAFIGLFILVAFSATAYADYVGDTKHPEVNEENFTIDAPLDLSKNEFNSETRAGIIFSTGNTRALTVSGSNTTLFRVKRWQNQWRLVAYIDELYRTSGTASPGTIAKYVFGDYRMDYFFLDKMSFYVGGGGYTDEIKGINLGGLGFAGINYYILMAETYSFKIFGGYAFIYEDRITPNPTNKANTGNFGFEYKHRFNEIVALMMNLNMFIDAADGRDIRLHSDTELQLKMTTHLGFVLGWRRRFYNQPVPGFKKLDMTIDSSLAKIF